MMLEDTRPALCIAHDAATPAERWGALRASEADWQAFRAMCEALRGTYFGFPVQRWLAWGLYHTVYRKVGSFLADSDFLADEVGVMSRAEMAIMQRQYTFAHLASNFVKPGCSSTCVRTAEGWRLMRSLDWGNLNVMAPAVRAYEYVNTAGRVTHTAGVQGMVGVLTFCRKGLAGSINFAPNPKSLKPIGRGIDPLFLLRLLVEDPSIDTLEAAVELITRTKLSAPVFITLCSDKSDAAAVIEIARDGRYNVRLAKDGLLVQTNHFDPNGPFGEQNPTRVMQDGSPWEWYYSDLLENSQRRSADLEQRLRHMVGAPATDVEIACREAYSVPPTWNHESIYWTFAAPGEGSMKLWVRDCAGDYPHAI